MMARAFGNGLGFLSFFMIVLFSTCTRPEVPGSNNPDDPDNPVEPNEKACPGLETVEHHGKTYNTVLIGNRCWLKENLNVGEMIQGTNNPTNNGVVEKYCYDNNPDNCEKFGGLYQWNELMNYQAQEGGQGICPQGWHIPTEEEMQTLMGTVDSQYGVGDPIWDSLQWRGFDAGGNLKEVGTEFWDHPNEGATNASGFSALPHGYREFEVGSFNGDKAYMVFWTSTQVNENEAWRRALSYYYKEVFRSHHDKRYGYSARCIKD